MKSPSMNSLVEEGCQQAVNVVRLSYASQHLLPSENFVFSRIIWVAVNGALKKQQLRRSCLRTREYFRKAFELNVSTISSITTYLVKLGFISKVQLRPDAGKWQQCMYKLTGYIWDIVKDVIIRYIKIINRVALGRHIVTKDIILIHTQQQKAEVSPNIKSPPLDNYLLTLSKKMGFEG